MKADRDGIIRQEWMVGDHPLPHAPVVAVRAAATVTTSRPPAAPPVVSVDTRIAEWTDRLQAVADDEVEGGGEEPGAVELIAEAAGLLQRAVDVALVDLERSTERAAAEAASQAADTIGALREEIVRLQGARRLDAERHRREVEKLAERLKRQEAETAAKVDKIHDALVLAEAETAEARSVDRLRTSSWLMRHRALVQQRLVARDLTKGSLQ